MECCDCIMVNSALQIGLGGLVVIKTFWVWQSDYLPCSVLFGLVLYFLKKLLSVEFFVIAIVYSSFILAGFSN